MEGIWCVLPSRMFDATAGLPIRISSAAIRPFGIFFHKVCATTPLSELDSIVRICD